MEIPRSYLENYSKSLNTVSEASRKKLVDALNKIDYTAPVADVRDAVIAVMQPACAASAEMSARLASDFYGGLRQQFGIGTEYESEPYSGRNPDATSGAVRAFVQDIVDGKPVDEFIAKCASRLDYESKVAANECVAWNARRDPSYPRWARVPVGGETCNFCIMLASRGFVYHTADTASHAHANCDCRVVPSWDKSPSVQGYSPEKYFDQWLESGFRPRSGSGGASGSRNAYQSRWKDVGEARKYLANAKTLEELYERADEVIADYRNNPFFKKHHESYGDDYFRGISAEARKQKKRLSK